MDGERAQQVRDEADYWQEIINILQEQNAAIGASAEAMAEVAVTLVSVAAADPELVEAFVGPGLDQTNLAIDQIAKAQKLMQDVIRLAEGRHAALDREIGEE